MTYEVFCQHCYRKLPAVASHIVGGLFCNEDCVAEYSVGRRKLVDDPRAE